MCGQVVQMPIEVILSGGQIRSHKFDSLFHHIPLII